MKISIETAKKYQSWGDIPDDTILYVPCSRAVATGNSRVYRVVQQASNCNYTVLVPLQGGNWVYTQVAKQLGVPEGVKVLGVLKIEE